MFIDAGAGNVVDGENGFHFIGAEFTNDGGCWFALHDVGHDVTVQSDGRFDFHAIRARLLELLAQLELDDGRLEHRRCRQSVLVSVQCHLDDGCHAVSELAGHEANLQFGHVLVEFIARVQLELLVEEIGHVDWYLQQ